MKFKLLPTLIELSLVASKEDSSGISLIESSYKKGAFGSPWNLIISTKVSKSFINNSSINFLVSSSNKNFYTNINKIFTNKIK